MKNILIVLLCLLSGTAFAQKSFSHPSGIGLNEAALASFSAEKPKPDPEEEKDKEDKLPGTFAVQILQNNVAGFYPLVLGSFGLSSKLSFTFYGVFWTNPSFGILETGSDLWFEYGAGLGFKALNNDLFLNPSLGFTNGKFLSGADQNIIGDGIVPSLFALYHKGKFETEFYLSYYKSLRSEGPVTRDFILNWVLPGVNINDHLALGVHYEQFVNTRVSGGDAASVYQWLGGYVRLTAGKGYSLRISAGKNLHEGAVAPEFYKISVFLPLLK